MRNRTILLVVLVGLLVAGCAGGPRVGREARPEGPFVVALLATADTRAELEPCG